MMTEYEIDITKGQCRYPGCSACTDKYHIRTYRLAPRALHRDIRCFRIHTIKTTQCYSYLGENVIERLDLITDG